jgi:probable F420-dependent oxidoreductase
MTATHRAFRFGVVFGLRDPQTLQDWRSLARKAEDLGYSTILLPDHPPVLAAPIPALMAAADATTTLRVGTYVFNNMLRNPAVLASDVATLDVFSNGRVELGLGAGNPFEGEFEALGLTNDTPGVRVRKLEEAVQVIKGYFSHEPFTFSGQHYTIKELTGFPAALQRPHPPIHLAAGQERMLTLAAHHADIITVQPRFRPGEPRLAVTAEGMDHQIARLRELAGERFSSLELSTQIRNLTITNGSAQESTDDGQQNSGFFSSIVGSVEQICERLYANRERFGFSYIVVMADNLEAFAPVVAHLAGK